MTSSNIQSADTFCRAHLSSLWLIHCRWIHGKQLLIAPFVGVSWWWLGSEHSSCLKMSTTKKRFRIRLCIILFFAGKEHRSNFHARFRVGKFFAYHHVAFQTPVLRTDVRVSCAKSMGTRESWGRRLRTYSDGSGGNTWHRHIMSLRISRTPGEHPCLCIRRLSWVIFPIAIYAQLKKCGGLVSQWGYFWSTWVTSMQPMALIGVAESCVCPDGSRSKNESSAMLLDFCENSEVEDSWILVPEAGLAQLNVVLQ